MDRDSKLGRGGGKKPVEERAVRRGIKTLASAKERERNQ